MHVFTYLGFATLLVVFTGFCLNILTIITTMGTLETVTLEFAVRLIGIVIVPIGAVMGFI